RPASVNSTSMRRYWRKWAGVRSSWKAACSSTNVRPCLRSGRTPACVGRTSMDQTQTEKNLSLLQRRLRVAQGQERGDLLLTGGQVVNVFTQRVELVNVVIADGWIAGVGPYDWQARQRIDLTGRAVMPGFIDSHMHLESTLLTPAELARL